MVTAEKTARTMLKQANELGNTLREIVRRDLADETRRFNDTLNQRIQLASEAIVQAVKAKEAINVFSFISAINPVREIGADDPRTRDIKSWVEVGALELRSLGVLEDRQGDITELGAEIAISVKAERHIIANFLKGEIAKLNRLG